MISFARTVIQVTLFLLSLVRYLVLSILEHVIYVFPDEAHKGKGDYAYAQVVRFMMAKNPHFRLLALTATPGSNPEAVQEIVDSLHISHIEIRDEDSIDLRQYMFKKVDLSTSFQIVLCSTYPPQKLELHIVSMDEDIDKIRDLLAKMMEVRLLFSIQKSFAYICPSSHL
jgi:ATP-dependent DNA helicase MPH1